MSFLFALDRLTVFGPIPLPNETQYRPPTRWATTNRAVRVPKTQEIA